MGLREIRKSQNLKQDYLAYKLGIKQNTYSQWENGQCEVSITYYLKLMAILNCSIEELVLALIQTKEEYDAKKLNTNTANQC